MPAVTVNTRKYNVSGSVREQLLDITGSSGDTLDVGLMNVHSVVFEPGTNTPTDVTLTPATPAVGQTRITFTSGGTFTNQRCIVKGT